MADELLHPILWNTDVFDARQYPQVELQVSSIGGTATPQRSFDVNQVNWENASGYSNNPGTIGNEVTSITADGFYVFEGGCWLRLTGGATGVFYIRGIA